MREARVVKFQKHLDPRAQEFWPRNPFLYSQICFLEPHIYYSYPYSYLYAGVPVTAQVSLGPGSPPLPPLLPLPSMVPTRVLLLISVPTDVSESTVRMDLEVFGEVREVQMDRLREGIVTVHFYDLRHADAAMAKIQEQHMLQQSRSRSYHDGLLFHHLGFEGNSLGVPAPPPARGLIAGRAVWAQFTEPETIGGPDGHNQGTLAIFNLDSELSASNLKEIFEAFGPVKELRSALLKQQQWFVEFFDVRDAARALSELNGKEINGKQVNIEFSHPRSPGRRRTTATTIPPAKAAAAAANSTEGAATKAPNVNTIRHITSRKYLYSSNASCPPPPPSPLNPGDTLHSRPSSDSPPRLHFSKKSNFSGDNSCRKSNGRLNYGSAAARVSSLPLIEDGIGKDCNKTSGRCSIKVGTNLKQATMKPHRGRPWKGGERTPPAHFLIKEEAIYESDFNDNRTTLMIKNIPNKYSRKLLMNMLDNHCLQCNEQISGDDDQPISSYDFFYLPIDFNNKCNVGYGFINLTSPQAAWRLYKAFHLRQWEVFKSKKICEVTYARLQGLEALKDHFKNSKFACMTDEYLPVMFSPPRDGKLLTDPAPIIGDSTPAVNNPRLMGGGNGESEGTDGGGKVGGDDNGNREDDICSFNDGYGDGVDGGSQFPCPKVQASDLGIPFTAVAEVLNRSLLNTEGIQQPKVLSC